MVELNRAMAVAMAAGPLAGLEFIDALVDEPSLRRYHLLPSARGDLLARPGRLDEARAELERAAQLTRNQREREQLLERAAALAAAGDPHQGQRDLGRAAPVRPGDSQRRSILAQPRGSLGARAG